MEEHCQNLPSSSLLGYDGRDALECTSECRRYRGLHSDLDRLERAEPNIGNEFGRSRCGQVETSLELLRVLLAHHL